MHKYNRVLKVLEVATIRLATVIMCLSKAKRLPQLEGKSLYYNNLYLYFYQGLSIFLSSHHGLYTILAEWVLTHKHSLILLVLLISVTH